LPNCLGVTPGYFCAGGSNTTADVCSICGDGKRVPGTTETCDEGPLGTDPTGTTGGCNTNCIGV